MFHCLAWVVLPQPPSSHVSLKFPTSIWFKVASWNDKVKMTTMWKLQSKYIHIFVHLQYLRIWQSYYFAPFYMSCSRRLLPWTWEIVALPHPFCAFTVIDSFPREGAWGVVGGQQSCTKWWTHTHRTGKRNPFCLRVRRGGMCPRETDFWMKVAELFLWCSEMSTLHNGYSGKFALGLFRQLLTTPNGEGFFFPCHVRQTFTKSGFSEDGQHTFLISWMDLLRRNRPWLPSYPCLVHSQSPCSGRELQLPWNCWRAQCPSWGVLVHYPSP